MSLEKTKENVSRNKEEEQPNPLYLEYLEKMKNPSTNEEVIERYSKELEMIASKYGQSVKELVHEAEFGGGKNFREEHPRVIFLWDVIAHLKQ